MTQPDTYSRQLPTWQAQIPAVGRYQNDTIVNSWGSLGQMHTVGSRH